MNAPVIALPSIPEALKYYVVICEDDDILYELGTSKESVKEQVEAHHGLKVRDVEEIK